MRLFRRQRGCPKPEPPSSTDESQRSWAVFRFFQNSASGACGSKGPSAAGAAAAAVGSSEENRRRQLHVAATDSLDDGSPVNYNFINQNFTPEVVLSTESQPVSPPALQLRQPQCAESHNSGTNAAAPESKAEKSKDLERYELWQQKMPRFHIGPRLQNEEDGNAGRRASGTASASSASSTMSEHLINLPPKFAFIYQDGKFVEREVTRWPRQKRALPHMRYRIEEPYASQYGERYKLRLASKDRIVTQKERSIYQNPIYRLPRRIMEENKSRLMTWHSLKDSVEGPKATTGPQRIEINQKEEAKIVKKMAERQNFKDAKKLVTHLTVKTGKATNAGKAT